MATTKIDEGKIFVIMGGCPAALHAGTQLQICVVGLTKQGIVVRSSQRNGGLDFGRDSAERTGHPGDQHERAEGEGGQPKRIDNSGALTIHIEIWEGNCRIHHERTSEELTVAVLCMCLNCTLSASTMLGLSHETGHNCLAVLAVADFKMLATQSWRPCLF